MNILYISQYFPPEIGAGAVRAREFSRRWADAGHRVTVLTGVPNYNYRADGWRGGGAGAEFDGDGANGGDGVDVARTWLWSVGDRRRRSRILSYSSFGVSSALRGLATPRPDVIFASSPPLPVGLAGWWIGSLKRRPFVFDVRDLWPESLIDLGAARRDSRLAKTLDAAASFLYRRAARVVVTSDASRDALIRSGKARADKVRTVTNGVETDMFAPVASASDERRALGFEDAFTVSFIGTIGMAHDVDAVLRAAARLSQDAAISRRVKFVFVGEGPGKARAVDAAKRMAVGGVEFLPAVPRERVPSVIGASDVCIVSLKKAAVNAEIIPVRLLEFMAGGKPTVAAASGQAARLLAESGGGLVVPQGDDAAMASAIRSLMDDPASGERMGANGRRLILERFTRERTAADCLALLEECARARRRG